MIWCINTYIITYVKTKKIRLIIHYVKPTAQVSKNGPLFKKKMSANADRTTTCNLTE